MSSRYFIGIALPQELSDQLFSFKWQLHSEIAHSLKPLVPHITLLHPSSLQDIPPVDILPAVRRVAVHYLPMTLSLESLETFEREVLYIAVHSPELTVLQSELVDLLPDALRADYLRRAYVPHITLAQVHAPYTLDIAKLRQRTIQGVTLPGHCMVNAISCFTQTSPREYSAKIIG